MHNGDARALLSSAVTFKLDEGIRDRIIAEMRGNPLALLELPRGLTSRQLAGGFGLVGAQALTGRIEESFVRRLEPLADDVRRLLLVAAAEPVGDPLLLWGAAERLGIGSAAAGAAEAAGLLAIGERVMFRHPLVRSAVYGSAGVEDRRAVHWRWRRRPIERPTRTAVRGIWPGPRRGLTNRSRWSSSARPTGRRRAAGSRLRRRSCSARSRSRTTRRSGPVAR